MSREITNSEAISNLNQIYGFVSPDIQRSLDLAIKALEERPQGEWVSKHLWDNTHVWVCSECGNRNTHGITVEKACWRCGADMRKGGAA